MEGKGELQGPYWEGGLSDEFVQELRHRKYPEVALAAAQWKRVIEATREESEALSEWTYVEIKYEDFMSRPHEWIRYLYDRCGLHDSERVYAYICKKNISSMNYKFVETFSEGELGEIEEIAGYLLEALGYELLVKGKKG